MVDVGDKAATDRRAMARAVVRMAPETAAAVARGDAPKGDVLGTARIAGIQAAKRTAELIPLCHPLALSFVDVRAVVTGDGVEIETEARTSGQTGVEMEALTAASVAALTDFGRRNPSFEWTAAADEVDRDTRTAELRGLRYWKNLFEAFDEFRTVIEREVVLDDEHVVFLVRHHARGTASGAAADRREAHLWAANADSVVSLREFATLEEARQSASDS